MLKQREIFYLHKRLCQIKENFENVFGGIAILMVEDIGQLSAVLGSVLWNKSKCKTQMTKMGILITECLMWSPGWLSMRGWMQMTATPWHIRKH